MSGISWLCRALLGLFLAAVAGAAPAGAAVPLTGATVRAHNVTAELVAAPSAIEPGQSFYVALHFDIRPGWHTYWRFAGDSGAATAINWALPPGFRAGPIEWPIPEKITLGPLADYGYEGSVFHLARITAPQDLVAGSVAMLKASATWLVCANVCVPERGSFALRLPVAASGTTPLPNPQWGARIAAAVQALPKSARFKTTASVDGSALKLSLRDPALAKDLRAGRVKQVAYFPYTDGIIKAIAPQMLATSSSGVVLKTEVGYLADKGKIPDPLPGLIVVTGVDGHAHGYRISAAKGGVLRGAVPLAPKNDTGSAERQAGIGTLVALLFAFLGGLILNLMPCVFPVLSMKALGFVRKAHLPSSELHLHGWLFTAGVLASFAVLAVALLALRATGASIGWGFQLQSPAMVLVLAYVMFAIGLSLSGVFTFGGRLAGIGDHLARIPGAAGDFFTGVLVAVVAAPCTAPFMGAAMGYAITAPETAAIGVFLALGAGLAMPYLALCHAPRLFARMPKPGPWMNRLKEALAFPMYATAAWLVWVLAQQAGDQGVLAALIGMVLIAWAAWVASASRAARGLLSWTAGVSAVAAIAIALGLMAVVGIGAGDAEPSAVAATTPALVPGTADEAVWQPYSQSRLDAALADGRPVFVNLTAAWCLTCKLNEVRVLSNPRVEAAFAQRNVLLLKGDWTRRNAGVTRLLTRFGRLGVPLYLYYSGDGASAKILPQILTEDEVIATLKS